MRARARAGDLAHALKTPLQALIGEAARLRAAGAGAAAQGIEEIAGAIDRHVQRELARAPRRRRRRLGLGRPGDGDRRACSRS